MSAYAFARLLQLNGRKHTQTCSHIYTHTHKRAHTHTHTHTHTHSHKHTQATQHLRGRGLGQGGEASRRLPPGKSALPQDLSPAATTFPLTPSPQLPAASTTTTTTTTTSASAIGPDAEIAKKSGSQQQQQQQQQQLVSSGRTAAVSPLAVSAPPLSVHAAAVRQCICMHARDTYATCRLSTPTYRQHTSHTH